MMVPLQGAVVIVRMIRPHEGLFPISWMSPPFISSEQYEFLLSSLPNFVKGCQWILLWSTLKHGIALHTLIRKSAALSGPCFLMAGDNQIVCLVGFWDVH